MIVVSDTSPIHYLVQIGAIHVLPRLFGRVVAPPTVIGELRHPSAPVEVRTWAKHPPEWLETAAPSQVLHDLNLDPGETAAILLAQELKADALLIDERRGSAVARNMGLFVTGTLGVLEVAAEANLIDLHETIAALRRTTFRAPSTLLDQALARQKKRASSREEDSPG